MAEIVKIRVEVEKGGEPAVAIIRELKNTVDYLNTNHIKLKIDASALDALTRSQERNLKNAVELSKAHAKEASAIASRIRAENAERLAKEKTLQLDKQITLEAKRRETAEAQRKTAIKQAEVAEKRAAQATAQANKAEKDRILTIERGKTALKQKQLQEEKTATAQQQGIARLIKSQGDLALQEERTNTIRVKGEQALALQQERTATAIEKARIAQEKENAATQAGVNPTNHLGNSLTKLVAQFVSLHMLLSRIVSAFRDALQTMKDVDSALVTIQKTTGFTGDQLDRLTNSAYELANAYGRTATEILNAASVYARAGFKDNLDQMTELSALLQNVGDLEGEVAAKFLIATNAAWKLNGSYGALMGVIDGLNAQTNQAAVDMEALTSGITVAGSVFANAGESVQTFAGLLGAGVALTQRSGSEVARGLRTIAMNIRQIKGELEDGEIVDEASISDAAAALHSIGISVADANGELRLTSDVLNELAGRWDSLTTAEQSYLAQSLAGKRQANILNALMNNWAEAQRQMTLYANGAGSAMQENEIYLNSWEAKTKQLSAAWTKFVNDLVDTDLIKGALDALIKLVNLLDSKLGRFVITVGGVATAFVALVSAVKGLTTAIAAMNGVMALNPLFLAAVGVTAGIYLLVNALNNVTSAAEEHAEAAHEAYTAYQSIQSEIDSLKGKTEELTEQERARLEILKEEARIQKEQAAELAKQALEEKYSVYAMSYDELQYKLEKAPRSEAADIINAMRKLESGKGLPQTSGGTGIPQYAGMLLGRYSDLQDALASAFADNKSLDELNALEEELRNAKQQIVNLAKELLDYSELMGEEFPQEAESTLKALNLTIDYFDGVRESTAAAGDAAEKAQEQLNPIRDRLESISSAADKADAVIAEVTDALNKYGASSLQVYDAMVKLDKEIPGSIDKLYDLETAEWKVDTAQFADKQSLLDFVDAARQAELQPLIDEMERASAAALELAGSIAMALPAGYNDQFLEAYKAENNPALQKLKQEKADWDSWVNALRKRSDYSSSGGKSSSTSSADPELETRKQAVALLKSELEFLKAKGASEEEIVAKQKQIQSALHDQAEYMREIGANQSDINALSTEWWKIQNEIAGDGEDILQQHKDRVALLKSELAILESKGASTDEINAKEREIQAAIKAQADYMESVGASQTEINALTKEWWDIENKILSTHEKILETVQKTIDEYYDKAITDKEKELQVEEKILAVQQAQAALANAQKERNVRYFNAASGQWEWGANQKNVKAAQDALKKAQDDLNKYQKEQAWKEFKDAWTYISDQIKAGEKTFQEAYAYMEGKMKDIQNKYNVDMSGVLNDSIGQFKGVNKTIKDLDDKTAAELSAGVKAISDQNANLATATANAKSAVDEFKTAYDAVVAKVKSGEMSFDDAYAYLKEQAGIISAKYGTDMTGALDKAIEEMESIYQDLDSIKEAVKQGKITPENAFEIISKALDSVSQKYGQDITSKVNKILDEKGGFKDGIGGLAQAVKDGKISIDDAFDYLEDATSEVADQYGIDMTDELNTAIQKMGKSGEALDDLWKTIVLNKMRMNSVSWLELDEQKKKAQASGDAALAKAIGEQQDQLHAENEALGKTIGATYDKSGHWSLNGSTLYDPAADRASGAFSGGGSALSGGIRAAADGDIASLESAFGNMNGTEKHYLPGIGWKNVGQAVADLFNVQAGAKGNDIIRMLILRYGTPEEATEYLNTGIVPASFAESYNGALPELFYSVPATRRGIYDVWKGGFNENGVYNGTAMVYGGAAGDSVVPVNNGKIGVSGLENTGSNILLTPDGQILRVNPDGTVVATGGTWAGHVATDQPTLQLLDEVIQKMAQSGQYTDEEIYGKKYDSGGLLHGVGGIKATARDEMVLPPDITSRLLSPVSNSFVSGRMDDLRSMLGMRTQFGTVDNTRIGTQNNGDNYVMNGVTISEGQARTTTVYDLAQIARSLGAYQRS